MAEYILVDLYLHCMIKDYRVALEKLSFSSFSKLMEAGRRTNESIKKTSKYNSLIKSNFFLRYVEGGIDDCSC